MSQVCPWCQTEIVWDEEIGPEESCPHCLNELGDYRSVSVDGGREDRSGQYGGGRGGADEDVVEAFLDAQDEMVECLHCQEDMVFAGIQKVEGDKFNPFAPDGHVPFLQAPFDLKVFVCRTCFQTTFKLAEPNRSRAARALHGDKRR